MVTGKANGEAGHLSSRKIIGETFFCIGSKNVHLIVRNRGIKIISVLIFLVLQYLPVVITKKCFIVLNICAIADLARYTDGRFEIAQIVAKTFFQSYMESSNITESQRNNFISYLQTTKYTANMELLQPANQHIEDLSHLTEPQLQFAQNKIITDYYLNMNLNICKF